MGSTQLSSTISEALLKDKTGGSHRFSALLSARGLACPNTGITTPHKKKIEIPHAGREVLRPVL